MAKRKIVQFLKNYKRGICLICLIFAFFAVFSVGINSASAGNGAENNAENNTPTGNKFIPVTEVPGTPTLPGTDAIERITYLVNKIFDNIRYLLAAIAIGMIVFSGFKLATSQGNEEAITKQKNTVIWWLLGLAVILFTKPFVEIFSVAGGGIFTEQKQTLQERMLILITNTDLIITYIKYIAGGLAVVFIVRAAYFLIISGDQEDIVTREKKNLGGALIALIVISISSVYVNQIIYKIKGDNFGKATGVFPYPDPQRGLQEIIGITNFVVTFAGPLAVLALMIGAVLYVTAGGEEDKMNKAKNILKAAIIGLIVIYSAYALVVTFVSGSFEGISQT